MKLATATLFTVLAVSPALAQHARYFACCNDERCGSFHRLSPSGATPALAERRALSPCADRLPSTGEHARDVRAPPLHSP